MSNDNDELVLVHSKSYDTAQVVVLPLLEDFCNNNNNKQHWEQKQIHITSIQKYQYQSIDDVDDCDHNNATSQNTTLAPTILVQKRNNKRKNYSTKITIRQIRSCTQQQYQKHVFSLPYLYNTIRMNFLLILLVLVLFVPFNVLSLALFDIVHVVAADQVVELSRNNRKMKYQICVTNAQCLNDGICQHGNATTSTSTTTTAPTTIASTAVVSADNFCLCKNGFMGIRCEQYCPLQCQNGGICHYIGNNNDNQNLLQKQAIVHEELIEHTDPKFHDTTDTNINHYACKCYGYYTGKYCSIPYINCDFSNNVQCFYGGICNTAINNTKTSDTEAQQQPCQCPSGYTGSLCTIPVNHTNPVDPELIKINNNYENAINDATASNKTNKDETIIVLILLILIFLSIFGFILYFGYQRYYRVNVPYKLISPGEGTICAEPYDVRDYDGSFSMSNKQMKKNIKHDENPTPPPKQQQKWRNIV